MKKLSFFLVLLSIFMLSFAVHAQEVLTPESYYQLAIALDTSTLNDLNDRMALLEQYKGDLGAFLVKEREALERAEAELKAVYTQYGVTPGEYGTFARTHQAELDFYLTEHPEVQGQLDHLQGQIDDLRDSYEALKEETQDS